MFARSFLLGCLAVLMAGCVEVHQYVTLNPDRSAKIRMHLIFDPQAIKDVSPDEAIDWDQEIAQAAISMQDLASQFITEAAGVEAWTDYEFKQFRSGRIEVFATAYSPDINSFELNPHGEEDIPNLHFTCVRRSPNEMTTTLIVDRINDLSEADAAPRERGRLSETEMQEQIAERQREFREESDDARVIYEPLRMKAHFQFPGFVKSVRNFQKLSPLEAGIEFTGKRFHAMIDRILHDESLAKKAFAHGWSLDDRIPLAGDVINELLFGEKGPAEVTIQVGDRPLFDYAAEVERARKNPTPFAQEP